MASMRCRMSRVVLIHDAARPFADQPLIDRVIAAASRTGAAVPAVPARDTVKRAREDRLLVETTIPRELIWLAQTPQGFRRDVLDEAVKLGAAGVHGHRRSDAGRDGGTSRGDRAWRRSQHEDHDIRRPGVCAPQPCGSASRGHWLRPASPGAGPPARAGRRHAAVRPRAAGPFGWRRRVPCAHRRDLRRGRRRRHRRALSQHRRPLEGRALVSTCSLARLPSSGSRGWRPSSADVTVILERPKVSPHVGAIRARLAEVLGIDVSHVSVKGKTNEGVDAVGRGEAIAAHAVAVLVAGPAR